MTDAIDRACREAVVQGIFPAAELLVAKGGEVVHHGRYGDARDHTCFDISSLTKPVCTASLAMMLVAERLLTLEDTVYQWLAGARRAAHRQMTLRHLLNHTSGMCAWRPYFRELPLSLVGTEAGKRIVLDACYAEELEAEPGTKTIYSDPGYILLGEIVEQAGGAGLDALFSQHIARPLGLEESFFVRLVGAPLLSTSRAPRQEGRATGHRRFAPTEDCPWRKRVVRGEVHDQNAYALGGVTGHAGLFSTASDLHCFALGFTRCWRGESDWIPKEVVRTFIEERTTKPRTGAYALGWDRPLRKGSASGDAFGPNTIGHLGYTGCSIWIDLEANFWVILLTNRIHPSITNEKIQAFRPQIHNLICRELIAR